IARSTPSLRRSTTRLCADTRTSTPGCRAWNRLRRGSSHSPVKPMVALTVTGRLRARSRTAPSASCSCCRAASALRNRRSPSAVKASERWPRRNSRVPSCSSSACTWRLTADWVRHSSRAASVMLSRRPTATKPRSRSSEGKRCRSTRIPPAHACSPKSRLSRTLRPRLMAATAAYTDRRHDFPHPRGFHDRMRTRARVWMVVAAAGVVMGLAPGVRHVQGLFLLPVTGTRGWSRELFALALAVQNVVWGLAQPLAGMVADRHGSGRVVASGVVLYVLGLYGMTRATSAAGFVLAAGVVTGLALAGTAFGVVYAAVSRQVPGERRAWAVGMAGAWGGLGQFLLVPATQGLIEGLGWQGALLAGAAAFALVLPLARVLREPRPAAGAQSAPPQALGEALREACGHRGFWLLSLGFLACGFQLAFIANHLPAYLADRGLAPEAAVAALATIALANVAGIYACGVLGGRYRPKYLLAGIYLARSVAIALFVLLPPGPWTLYPFAAVMGLMWLGTVPLTNGVLSGVFGLRYLGTLFGLVFIGHQLGSFLGVWMGGRVFEATGSYALVWLLA